MTKRILAVVAHADDEAIGCGGTLLKHAIQGDNITIIYMTDGVSSRSNTQHQQSAAQQRNVMAKKVGERLNAQQHFFNFPDNKMDQTPLLEVTQAIESVIDEASPDIVYCHHYGDLNVDHRIVHQTVMTAFRPIPNKKTPSIYSFEVNSSTEWNSPVSVNSFMPNYFVDISQQLKDKETLLNFYHAEMHSAPHTRSIEAIIALAKVRGSSVGVNHAEAFMLMREVSI